MGRECGQCPEEMGEFNLEIFIANHNNSRPSSSLPMQFNCNSTQWSSSSMGLEKLSHRSPQSTSSSMSAASSRVHLGPASSAASSSWMTLVHNNNITIPFNSESILCDYPIKLSPYWAHAHDNFRGTSSISRRSRPDQTSTRRTWTGQPYSRRSSEHFLYSTIPLGVH